MKLEPGEILLQGGMTFKRLDDGSVRILVRREQRNQDADDVLHEVVTTASGWASVVASVSARDENHETHAEALAFHEKQAT